MIIDDNPRVRNSPRRALYRLAFRLARAAWHTGGGRQAVASEPLPSASPAGSASTSPWEPEPVLDDPAGPEGG